MRGIKERSSLPVRFLAWLGTGLSFLLLAVGLLACFSARWYLRVYGDVGFSAILNTLFGPLDHVEPGLIRSFLRQGALPALAVYLVLICVLLFRGRRRLVMHLNNRIHWRLYPLPRPVSAVIALLLAAGTLSAAALQVGLPEYIRMIRTQTTFLEDHYVDPDLTPITFPQDKQNLIVIYLESMETSFLSRDLGGGNDVTVIPELYDLARDNLNFSQNDSVGGFRTLTGTSWTIAAILSSTAGVPLKDEAGISLEHDFLPGLTTLSDILHDNGYYQAFMMGSDGSFAGRRQYALGHQTDQVYDLFTAREDGIIPEDYYVWWGMEDLHLFEYAKQELTRIAAQDQPFAFSMLTVDTHHIGGYVCSLCRNEYPEQYETVLACSSRQVADFVQWIQQQDFYENTTIVITGDHCSMDNQYIENNIPAEYERKVYNCFINPRAVPQDPKNRDFSSLDMFPTLLASIGCTIEGDRLGLGTNLFSSLPTLCEQLGAETFDRELSNYSRFYVDEFM